MNLLAVLNLGEAIKDKGLFDDIKLYDKIDRDILIQQIIYHNWELEPMITDYFLLKSMIHNFFDMKYNDYARIYEALMSDYNPIHNYDRYEDFNEKRLNKRKDSFNGHENNVSENTVSAYNSDSYQPSDKNSENIKTDDIRQIEDDDSYTTNNHLYGNIGVTTSQQMLESEINLRLEKNLYRLIAIDFRKEFMLSCL